MTRPRTPLLLRAWLVLTKSLSSLIIGAGRYAHKKMGAPAERFPERLGQTHLVTDRPVVWFHAASLGEVMQIGGLADRMRRAEDVTILVTTTTASGADWVRREMPFALHQFAPLDVPRAVERFLNTWPVAVSVFVEGDLWPRLVLEAQKRSIPQVLLNARHSQSRERFGTIFGTLLSKFALVTCRSTSVAEGIASLGVPDTVLKVLPDLRISARKLPIPEGVIESLSEGLQERPIWLAASTHQDDEAAVLAAHQRVIQTQPEALLIIAPRHPRRGAPLEETARALGLACARRSTGERLAGTTQLYVADTLGEMGAFFSVANVAFVGGSFGNEGGHNPYEPASFGTAIVSGQNVRNFADAYASLTENGAALLVRDPDNLGNVIVDLLGSDKAAKMGDAGRNFMAAGKGGLDTHARLVIDILRKELGQGKTS